MPARGVFVSCRHGAAIMTTSTVRSMLAPLSEAETAALGTPLLLHPRRASPPPAAGWPLIASWSWRLYAPGLGYYSAGAVKLGAGGDFVTAPEMSKLFAQCLARQCAEVLAVTGGGDSGVRRGNRGNGGERARDAGGPRRAAGAIRDSRGERRSCPRASARALQQLPEKLRQRVVWLTASARGAACTASCSRTKCSMRCLVRDLSCAASGVRALGVAVTRMATFIEREAFATSTLAR